MRRFSVCFLFFLTLALSAWANADTAVSLEKTSLELVTGSYGWIRSHLLDRAPSVSITSMTWESTDESVVMIDRNAKYTAAGPGEADLIRRIRTSDGQEYTAVCHVRVLVPVESLSLDSGDITLAIGGEIPLPEVRVLPENASVRSWTWSCDHPELVRISGDTLTALSAGHIRLTATSDERLNGRRVRSASLLVHIIPAVDLLAFRGYGDGLRLEVNTSVRLALKTRPDTVPMSALHFESSDTSILAVSSDGTVRGLSPGQCTVTVWTDQTKDGTRLDHTLPVTVWQRLSGLSLKPSPRVAFRGQTIRLTPVFSPPDADTSTLSLVWTSENPYVAEPDAAQGFSIDIHCRQVGTGIIRVSDQDGSGLQAGVKLTVEPDLPVRLLNLSLEQGRLRLKMKSRMHETWIRGISFHGTYLDADGLPVSEVEIRAPFAIRPSRFVSYDFALDPPEKSASLLLRITGISHDGGDYDIPLSLQSESSILLP